MTVMTRDDKTRGNKLAELRMFKTFSWIYMVKRITHWHK
jgi:hypothetical protein